MSDCIQSSIKKKKKDTDIMSRDEYYDHLLFNLFDIMLIYNFLFFIFDLLRIQRYSFTQFVRRGLAQEINNNQTTFWASKSKKIILYGQYYQLIYPKISIRESILSAKTYMTEIFIPVLLSKSIVNSLSPIFIL